MLIQLIFNCIDYSDEVTTLPADHPMMHPPQHQDLQNMDPGLIAQLQAQLQEEELHQLETGNLSPDANPLLLFLQTLLPWNTVQNRNARNGE